MAGEVQVSYPVSGSLSLGYVIYSADSGGLAYTNSEAWATYGTLTFGSFFRAFANSHGGTYYYSNFPQSLPAGVYNLVLYDFFLGGFPNPGQGNGQIQWVGSVSGSRYVASYSLVAT